MNLAALSAPPLGAGLNARLSLMMFLQYAIWGAWLPVFFPFMIGHRQFTGNDVGSLVAYGAIGVVVAPFVAGQIADRWFNTEKFLAISHLAGAVIVWQIASATDYSTLRLLSFAYGLVYGPTLGLTNSLALHHLPDRDRDFGKVRVWGTIGWIAAGIGLAQWLRLQYTGPGGEVSPAGYGDSLRLSAILGAISGLYGLTLPKTPPSKGAERYAPGEALREIVREPTKNPLFWLFLLSLLLALVHQLLFIHTAQFLVDMKIRSAAIDAIFGVGGGGLMTIGQMAEIVVIALIPFLAKKFPRKTFLAIGLVAYILRYAVFAYVQHPWAIVPALALHGLCFGAFFFVAFMIVDEETTADVRASVQAMYTLIIFGFGIIAGSKFAGMLGDYAKAKVAPGNLSDYYSIVYGVPMWMAVGCLVLLLVLYPSRRAPPAAG